MLAGSRDERFNTGQIACGCCKDRVKVALTDATHYALRPEEA